MKILFEEISFGLDAGQKIALIGINGSGKTSLLKVLSGEEGADGGSIIFRNDIRVGVLKQNPDFEGNAYVWDYLMSADKEEIKALKRYEALLNIDNPSPNQQDALQQAIENIDTLKAWDYEVKIKQILTKLHIDYLDKPISFLSGGQRKRVALAKILIDEPELLILDEPTNHLDMDSIEWLEKYLSGSKQAVLMVTHDRYFLDHVTNEIFELENGQLFQYKGNFEYYLEAKAEREERLNVQAAKAKKLLKIELEWLRRSPKARTTKSRSRIKAAEDLKVSARKKFQPTKMNFKTEERRLGGKILELQNLSKAYGDLKILDNFSYSFRRKERIGIIGPNGVGKTTFLKMLVEEERYNSGKIIKGTTVSYGYYRQGGLTFKPGQKVIDIIRDVAETITLDKGKVFTATEFLYHFRFNREMQFSNVENLSGGEKRRLYLVQILIQNPNFLILDEPTNDLDLLTLSTLESFLLGYKGCLIIVSHDRYFMDKLVDHVFVFKGEGQIKDYPGNYTQYQGWAKKEAEEKAKIAQAAKVKTKKPKPKKERKRKLSYKEKKEYEQLEVELVNLEDRQAELEDLLQSGETDFQKLTEWTKEMEKVSESLDEVMMRWMELDEIANG